ncbi:MAG: GDSL-type esterase/lipase family protein [Prevotellaceae bacterium]|nr:GDSL-type esterase/lipase family protein [Prevotellaceae bacterium]
MRIRSIFLTILFACVAAVMTAQHISYRPTPHYGQRVDEFEKQPPIDSTDIVMLGNSLTENAKDWNQWLRTDGCVLNRGIIGDTAKGILARLSQILPGRPKAIFLMCGINDVSHGLSPEAVFSLCRQVIDSIRNGSPTTKLYVESLLPILENSRWKSLHGKTNDIAAINTMLQDYCQQNGITFIDLFHKFTRGDSNVLDQPYSADGLHVTRFGYKVWASELRPYIKEITGKRFTLLQQP